MKLIAATDRNWIVEVDEVGVGGVLIVPPGVKPHQDRVLIWAKREVITLQLLLAGGKVTRLLCDGAHVGVLVDGAEVHVVRERGVGGGQLRHLLDDQLRLDRVLKEAKLDQHHPLQYAP